jgi:hypothetical protein
MSNVKWWVLGGSAVLGVVGLVIGMKTKKVGAGPGLLVGAVAGAALGYGATKLPMATSLQGVGVMLPVRRRVA